MNLIKTRYNESLILYLLLGYAVSFLTSLFALQLFAAILFLLWLFEPIKQKKLAVDNLLKIVLLFCFVRVVTAIFSEYPEVSSQIFYKELVFYLSVISLNFYIKTLNNKKLNDFLKVFLLSVVVVAIIGIVRFNLNLTHRANSFVSGYSTYSMFLLVSFAFLIGIKNKLFPNLKWYYYSIPLAIILAGLFTSMGRTNIAAAIFIGIVALILKTLKIKEFGFALALAVLISLISFNNNSKEFNHRTETITTMSDRDIILKGVGMIWEEHPFLGFGPKTFKKAFPIYEEFKDQGIGGYHNQYIESYMDSGVLGLIMLLAIPIYLFIHFYFLRVKMLHVKDKEYILIGLMFSFTVLYISVLTDGFVGHPIMEPVFALFLAFTSREFAEDRGKS